MQGSAVEKVILRRLDGALTVVTHSQIQPGLDADIILYPSRNGMGPLAELVPTFTLCPAIPWEDGVTMYCALPEGWRVFPAPSASNSGNSQALYLAAHPGEEELLLQYLPAMSHTSCHRHHATTEIIAALAGECYCFHTSVSGIQSASRIPTSGMRFEPGVSHCLWTHQQPAINIITMRGRGIFRSMADTLVMDMSDHHPAELPQYLRSRNRLR